MYNGQLVTLRVKNELGQKFEGRIICMRTKGCAHHGILVQILTRPLPKQLPGLDFDLHRGYNMCVNVNSKEWPLPDLCYATEQVIIDPPELDMILGL